MPLFRGTEGSNPSPSCAESCANLTFGLSAYMTKIGSIGEENPKIAKGIGRRTASSSSSTARRQGHGRQEAEARRPIRITAGRGCCQRTRVEYEKGGRDPTGPFSPGTGAWFALDSLLEEDGFELSVPR